MIIDSSALVAIFLDEPGADALLAAVAADDGPKISAGTLLETGIVLSHRKGRPMQHALELFLSKLGVQVVAFTEEHCSRAIRAWWIFGKTRSAAKLNFGDCISYATAELADEPLLCVGDDFARTDLPIVKGDGTKAGQGR